MRFEQIISKLGVDSQEFIFQFQSHPNYPSALAFSDTLNFMGIKNNAYELEKEYWEELPKEFITINEDNFILVQRNGNQANIFSDKKEYQISFNELKENSSNFVLLFDKGIEEKGSKKDHVFQKTILVLAFGILFFNTVIKWNIWSFLFQLLSFSGLYIFSEIFKEKFGKESQVLQNFCGIGAKYNVYKDPCKTIIQSDDFLVFGLRFSDFGFIYFIGLSVLPLFIANTSVLFLGISSMAVCSVIYSVYYQLSKKSFCKVCSLVIIILISQFLISYLFLNLPFQNSEILITLFIFLTSFFAIYEFSLTNNEKEKHKNENIKNLRFKRNYEIFKDQLIKEENNINFKVKTGGFILGNPDTELKISIVSNLFCGFCKDAHSLLEKLVLQYPENLHVQIRFNYGGKNDTELTNLLSIFKYIYENQGGKKFSEALKFWYKTRDMDLFKQKYPFQNNIDLSDIIELSRGNTANNLNFTPLLIINNYRFPQYYDREDFVYFLDDLLEENI